MTSHEFGIFFLPSTFLSTLWLCCVSFIYVRSSFVKGTRLSIVAYSYCSVICLFFASNIIIIAEKIIVSTKKHYRPRKTKIMSDQDGKFHSLNLLLRSSYIASSFPSLVRIIIDWMSPLKREHRYECYVCIRLNYIFPYTIEFGWFIFKFLKGEDNVGRRKK